MHSLLYACSSKKTVSLSSAVMVFVSKAFGPPSPSVLQMPLCLCSYSLQEQGETLQSQGQMGQDFHVFTELVPYPGRTKKVLNE